MTIDAAIAFLEAVYGALGDASSLADKYTSQAQTRLGIELPADLVTYYRRTGRAHGLHHAHNELVPPERLDFADDHLVIYEENQAVVVWGIARAQLTEPNPAVDQGQRDGEHWAFHSEFTSLGEFAAAQGAWQAVQGALPYCGVLDGYPNAIADTLGTPTFTTSSMKAWLVPNGVCVDAGNNYLGLATRDADAFEAASTRLKLAIADWDWATLQD